MTGDHPFQPISTEDGPQLAPILAIHRGKDGFVSFARKNESGQWEELPSVRVETLASIFPEFRQELIRDSFYSVNAFYRDGNPHPKWPTLGRSYRKTGGLRYLNVCYADLDCYKQGFDSGLMTGIVLSVQDKRVIPPVSIFARSGRGVWLFWILEDPENPGQPPRAWPEKVALWTHIC